MSKCGILAEDIDKSWIKKIILKIDKPKIKLYRDKEGNIKGDALCCYLKVENINYENIT